MVSRAELKYYRMSAEERQRLLSRLREELEADWGIVFAYVHGGFVEAEAFRDVDVAVWIEKPEEAFRYQVDFSARLETRFKIPLDLHVLNEAPLPFKHSVFTRGKLLFSRDEDVRVKVVDEIVRQYADVCALNELARKDLLVRTPRPPSASPLPQRHRRSTQSSRV